MEGDFIYASEDLRVLVVLGDARSALGAGNGDLMNRFTAPPSLPGPEPAAATVLLP